MPMFGRAKKAAGGAAMGTVPLSEKVGAGWGIRGKHGPLKNKEGVDIPCKGDIYAYNAKGGDREAPRFFRKKLTKAKNPGYEQLTKSRDDFVAQLKKLEAGYKSLQTLKDFECGTTLGTGSFGRVLMVKRTAGVDKENVAAMKIISKDRVVKTRQVEHTFNEKNILFSMNSPFIVKMYDYFVDAASLYFILEFVNGGEMFTHIQKQKRRKFNPEQTRFFAAETVLAFEYLHNLDIIFRDLKPENMLIDCFGHIRLTDFGFAKRVEDKTWTMCGTPEYLAPEIIVNKGYNHAVDWWAVGVLIYEMRCGRSPFEANSQLEMFKKISRREFKYPRDFLTSEMDLIGSFLQVDLTKRIGNLHAGVEGIKSCPYWTDKDPKFGSTPIDFAAIQAGMVPSPYTVKVHGPEDTSQFDRYPEEKVQWVTTVRPGDKNVEIFQGF